MLALKLVGVDFAHSLSSSGEMAVVASRRIGLDMPQATGLEQRRQLDKDCIRSPPQRLG